MSLKKIGDDGSPVFIPISFTANVTTPITGDTTVTFVVNIPTNSDGSEPDIDLSFYAMQGVPDPSPVNIPNPPVPVWTSGVPVFSLTVDSDLMNAIGYDTTLLLIYGQARNAQGQQLTGMCVVAISYQQ